MTQVHVQTQQVFRRDNKDNSQHRHRMFPEITASEPKVVDYAVIQTHRKIEKIKQ